MEDQGCNLWVQMKRMKTDRDEWRKATNQLKSTS